ncbi:AAA family ATPase [Helicobacter muridarum]|uniref:Chaperone protein ClpB n=1 Tax=Helicobacter muridarum TaxID=216 RepID=A0A377PWG0_9HELI|nr:AAA family ATPase [Helicobacter muridarum]TLD99614.1 AAA family ATPase [Helicobacter muridarum]STQ86774.1 ATP-dependent CLP protease ATP-binding subunit [Helicobacter muridarum]
MGSTSKINENLGFILQKALGLVEELHQDIMTVEHVFYSLLEHPLGGEMVMAIGGNVPNLMESTVTYLDKYIPKAKQLKQLEGPSQTLAFSRVFDQMIIHAQSANKSIIGIGDFLVALMKETDCYASQLLRSQGIEIDDVMRIAVEFDEDKREREKHSKGSLSNLEKYAKNLNKIAKEGKIDPLIGREYEINQIAQVLCRRKKNNPILLGEAGVGKSAIVEGLALRIVEGNVPKKLLDSVIYAIDVSSVIAGTKYRGEFETRIKKILAEIENDENTIIFFDEIHMIVGAGQSHNGSMDFSNLLKPMLSSGKLRCIGATTISEYKTSFDKDKALARRFTQIKIDEPSEEECLKIIQKIAPIYERFHNVTYEEDALKACVTLSAKYISEKHLPDKAIDLLDEAGAKAQLNEYTLKQQINLSQTFMSGVKNDAKDASNARSSNDDLPSKSDFELDREQSSDGIANGLSKDYALTPLELKEIDSEKKQDSKIYRYEPVKGIVGNSAKAESNHKPQIDFMKNTHKVITQNHIELLMSDITNIPKSTINANESSLLKNLDKLLKKRIFSQDAAIEKIVEKITINKAGLSELNRPIASFLFTGPSGVGKTELSKELARILGIKFERIDMSEYMEPHSISKLIGSPAGYVGYDEGGLLVNKIRVNPHCVLLLDEIEKAHSDVYNILLQIMDSATLTDNQNNKADFKNVILIMTTNAGSKEGNSMGFLDTTPNRSDKAIKDTFSPEFRSRLDAVIVFKQLGIYDMQRIADKYISDLNATLKERCVTLKLLPKAAKFIAQSSIDAALGAREIKKIIDSVIKLPLGKEILFGKLRKGGAVNITVKKNELALEIIEDKVLV